MSYIILLQPVAPIPVSVDATSAAGENVSTESAESNGERPTSPSTKPSALGVGSSGNFFGTFDQINDFLKRI